MSDTEAPSGDPGRAPRRSEDVSIEDQVARVQAMPDAAGRSPVVALNSDAGSHAITTDPRELRAALRAGERTWRRFPYYEHRYGERGRRFTSSDSAWIVTLTELPLAVAETRLRWLGRVLAARGMPRWLLETHLGTLYSELVAEGPEKHEAYAILRQIADRFSDERHRHLDEATFTRLAAEFDRRAGPPWAARLPEMGALLAAAVVDERAGIERAVTSVLEWVGDPQRFPDVWCDAVAWTVDEARKAVSGR